MATFASSSEAEQRVLRTLHELEGATDRYRQKSGYDPATVRYARTVIADLKDLLYNKERWYRQKQFIQPVQPLARRIIPMAANTPSTVPTESKEDSIRKLRTFFWINGWRSMWGTMMRHLLGGDEAVEKILGPGSLEAMARPGIINMQREKEALAAVGKQDGEKAAAKKKEETEKGKKEDAKPAEPAKKAA